MVLTRPLADRREIAVTTDIADAIYAFADRQRVNQILLNLLSNAVKYNRHGGLIEVRVRSIADRVLLEVSDSGAGIPADKLALLFTPFERLGAEQTAIEGTGLGLALSRRLAAEMGGTLTVESVVDRGSVFRLTLPLTKPAASIPPKDAGAPQTDTSATMDYAGSVLYIEDNISNVLLMQRILKRRPGVTLRHAPDGAMGLAMLRAERPGLVLLDLHLADLPGEEVLRRIWEDRALRSIPVAVLSADATVHSRRHLLASGAIAYLTKPLDLAKLLQVVDDALSPHG